MREYGTVDYISGNNEAYGRFYVLKKATPAGDQLMVIQASAVIPESHMAIEVVERCSSQWGKQYTDGLEIIQTLLPRIQFGQTNWAYLVGNDNNYRLIHKHQPLPIVTEIPWCPLVDESDIEITHFLYAEDRHGIWNGVEVDLFMAWDASYTNHLQKRMAAHRLLMERNLEHLTFRAVGHVVRDGTAEICGLMTEASYGRIFEYCDRSAVYKAIAQIERAGLLFTGIHTSNIMITADGQVRFLSLCALMRQPDDPIKRAEECEYWHWEQLEKVFEELKLSRNPIPPPREQRSTSFFLPQFPAPAHGPKVNIFLVVIAHDLYSPVKEEQKDVKGATLARRNCGTRMEVLVLDAPISPRSLHTPKMRLHAYATVPYRKLDKPDKLLQELISTQNWQSPLRDNSRFD
ncbi:hypothetical protein MSAN_00573000 [Mycena sanguinolenta]|uniref:Uncharacterized protein n=1 Tax=Mycena sanguinolenta TaxID=230812 RepID=A0A8H6ZC73_9AGAR|nr:hypothetical protein MSAN_00573000 [Mycena sanguinolenta]